MFPVLFISVFISFLHVLFFCFSLPFLLSTSLLYNSIPFIQWPKLKKKSACEVRKRKHKMDHNLKCAWSILTTEKIHTKHATLLD